MTQRVEFVWNHNVPELEWTEKLMREDNRTHSTSFLSQSNAGRRNTDTVFLTFGSEYGISRALQEYESINLPVLLPKPTHDIHCNTKNTDNHRKDDDL